MSKKDDQRGKVDEATRQSGLNRRDLFKASAAAGVSAAALTAPGLASRAYADYHQDIEWHYEADVVVIGGGATGLPAAIRARDLGASVIVVEQSFEVGGKALHSGGWISLGGGDAIQQRDRAGDSDPDGFVQVEPLVPEDALDDNAELLFRDKTDWSAVATDGTPRYRYNDRAVIRGWADHAAETRQFLMDNYVRFGRIDGTHRGGGVSRARSARAILKVDDVTDMEAGTVSRLDAGDSPARASTFSVTPIPDRLGAAGEDVVGNGAALQRPLEYSARKKGVRFMVNRHMDEIIRRDMNGRVEGITASYTPVYDPDTGAKLRGYWTHGDIDETRDKVNIRARKAVIVAAGGHEGNPVFRKMFYPALGDSWFPVCDFSSLGGEGRGPDASGIIAGMKVGAHLAGMGQNNPTDFSPVTRLGVRSQVGMAPGYPTFGLRKAIGVNVGAAGLEHLIYVDQVGRRWYNEERTNTRVVGPAWPGGPDEGTPDWRDYTPGDWRNCDQEWIREIYRRDDHDDAILQVNEGSQGPDYYPGPKWAIFDQAAVERGDWNVEPPFTGDNGLFFRADTLAELAQLVSSSPYSVVSMPHLEETVERWNSFVDEGEDEDFGRENMHRIDTPPFYAAAHIMTWHDSNGGLRIDGRGQVIDMKGEVIPGLYAGGESSGGDIQHGLGRALVQGYICGTFAVQDAVEL